MIKPEFSPVEYFEQQWDECCRIYGGWCPPLANEEWALLGARAMLKTLRREEALRVDEATAERLDEWIDRLWIARGIAREKAADPRGSPFDRERDGRIIWVKRLCLK